MLLALVCGIAAAGSTFDPLPEDLRRGRLLSELARAHVPRTIAPRLSIPTAFRPCTLRPPDEGTVPVTDCGTGTDRLPSAHLLDLASRATAAVTDGVDPGALHAAALVDLLWADEEGISLNRSISYLQTASRLADRPAPVLADLAAAYLVRAERHRSPRDLLEAIEAADRAVELEPRNPAGLYNLALALDRLGPDGQAAETWRRFVMVDSTSEWAEEAGRRRRELTVAPARPAPPAAGASEAEVEAYVARSPQEARLLGWDVLLGEWGEAVLAGDSTRAEEKLRLAATIGDALVRRGGDATLADAVGAIRACPRTSGAYAELAAAHHAFSRARSAFLARDFEAASGSFRRATAGAGSSEALRGWTTLFTGATLLQDGDVDAGERVLREVVAEADTLGHVALAAHSRWAQGLALLRSGRSADALGHLHTAARLFQRIGEVEHAGALHVLAADAEYTLGDQDAMHGSMHRALVTLRRHRGSVWRHNLLYIWAEAAATEELARTAVRLQEAGVDAAVATESPMYVAEARLAHARLLTAAGDTARAVAAARAAGPLVAQLPHGTMREWFTADLWLTGARLAMGADPRRSEAGFDSVVAFFAAIDNPARLLPALVGRAEARLAAGRVTAAEADLERAIRLLDAQHAATRTASLRASLLDAARRVVDRSVMLRVAAGDPSGALHYLERGRASFAPVGSPRPGRAREGLAAPAGHVAVEYALIGDTLLAWTVSGRSVRLRRTTVDRERFTQLSERARTALELRAAEAAVQPDLAALYDLLVRPVEEELGPEGTPLLLVADGEVAGIPFAALFDSVRGRYVIEDHPLRFLNSLRDARVRSPAEGGPEGVLLVADPAFDARAYPGLGRLPGARAEVAAVAAAYPGAAVLEGADADRAGVEAALGRATIAHFAGHAVFDDDRPAQSHLVLAAQDGGRGGASRLTAGEVERLDLRSVRLVVLSACQTSRAHGRRSGGFAGLAGALMAAGAGGVVGSLWRVDDETTRALMVEFHRAYRASGDPAAALQEAQVRLLRSSDPAQRSPAAWAGFRYVGG